MEIWCCFCRSRRFSTCSASVKLGCAGNVIESPVNKLYPIEVRTKETLFSSDKHVGDCVDDVSKTIDDDDDDEDLDVRQPYWMN